MKENMSFFKLAIRSSFYKFLLLTALVCLIQAAMFAAYTKSGRGLESALNAAPITAAAGIGLAAATFLFILPWVKSGSGRPAITLNRLRITNMRAALWLAVYNSLCFLIYWAAQLALFLLLCKGYLAIMGASGQLHLICLAAWRVNYFHMLLPLGDVIQLVRDIILVVGLAVTAVVLAMETSAASGLYTALIASSVILVATDGAGVDAITCSLEIGELVLVISVQIMITARACRNKDEPYKKERKKRRRPDGRRGRKGFAA